MSAYRIDDHGLNKCAQIYNVQKAPIKSHFDGKNANNNTVKLFAPTTVFNTNMEERQVKHILL